MAKLSAMVLLAAVALGIGCTFQAQQCCDCMSTKDVGFFGDCLTESIDVCVEQLAKDPPNVDVVQSWCRSEDNPMCPESCADVLYRK